ncbi:hypothetical protein FRACYDRAFT_272623 [Fragilariopsis cylindrus CCMP1102]|uniref:Uncharacterized protein n=1 Tax=Fragilariopsis cylindrus CCMP1102 TaxID=635003 RepID=A0A1E7ELE5_9STRA|nr:hypothetical protein FRACYDRAFT_272623 [Fragilariopsis cylindrus CCMP1102]|eukprot:OEU06695.1 hypothetical protein FRACYDRAFT_272623 [Fragilariopsis cylindrus CCMP1102]
MFAKLALLFVVIVVVSVQGFAPPAMQSRVAYNTELNGAFDFLTKEKAAVVEAPVKVVKKNPFAKKVKEAAPVKKEAKSIPGFNLFAKKEAPAKKAAPVKKVVAKKAAPVKKVVAKKAAPVKKVVAKKAAPVKKVVTKKAAPVKKVVAAKKPVSKKFTSLNNGSKKTKLTIYERTCHIN